MLESQNVQPLYERQKNSSHSTTFAVCPSFKLIRR